ncbi:hypothetical protein ATANTOWER_022042 [Ataeniobius toweri]|uniref:Uncharacterized protein n=1 Tax=Ataeniobius toweri TaxID=208326 RepID=A0ABU7ACI5_9TELE|nr:hypothetical protein [Ataeniobius toweri]
MGKLGDFKCVIELLTSRCLPILSASGRDLLLCWSKPLSPPSPLTGGNTEPLLRLFPDNLRSGINIQSHKAM